MNFKHFISELKRRNVFKVATAYAITGWLIIQIVTSISQPLSLPVWFDAVIIILVLIGFPISLLFAWAFEMTSDGLKKTTKVEVEKSVTKNTGKKLNLVIITTLLLLVAFLLNDKFSTKSIFGEQRIASEMPSIAVLPFADMSPEKDQEYFSDGLSEELLNVLAKVNNLKVAGRTSSFKFKGKNDDLRKIGKELGVNHILEGSVRKSGNTIRITAQLIKVEDGFHIWSETYDEDYTADNLFQIQDDISKKILKELKINLSIKDENAKTHVLTSNTKAYEAYLKGNQLLINRKPKDIEDAILEFKKAIVLDDQFAMAYARLATSYGHLFKYGSIKRGIAFKSMRENIDKALLLNNNLGSAYAALGHYYKDKELIYNEVNFNSYKEAMKKAYELESNNPEIIMWYGNSLDFDTDERIEIYLKALEIDPLAPVILQNLANTYYARKEYKKAEEYAKRNIDINPEYIRTRIFLIEMLTKEPNSKLGEGFIETYKTYKKYPENLDVLNHLTTLSTNLKLFKVAEEMEEIMKRVYPENPSLINIKVNNLMNRQKFDEAFKFIDSFFKKMNLKEGSTQVLSMELAKNQILKQNPEINYNYLKKYHSIFLSDTLTILPDAYEGDLPSIIVALKTAKHSKQTINNLIRIYSLKTEKEYKFNGDITKEKIIVLNRIANIAILKDDAKLYSTVLNEFYFNRKSKSFDQNQVDIDASYDGIRNTKEVKEIHTKIRADIDKMRATAIAYLKDEDVWEKYKE